MSHRPGPAPIHWQSRMTFGQQLAACGRARPARATKDPAAVTCRTCRNSVEYRLAPGSLGPWTAGEALDPADLDPAAASTPDASYLEVRHPDGRHR